MEETPSEHLKQFLLRFKGLSNCPAFELRPEALVARVYVPSDVSYFYEKVSNQEHAVLPAGIQIDSRSAHVVVTLEEFDLESITIGDPNFFYLNMGFGKFIEEISNREGRTNVIFDLGNKSVILNHFDLQELASHCLRMKQTIQLLGLNLNFGSSSI